MSFNFCERCTSGSVLPGEPKGELRGDAYFAAGPAELRERNKSKAIILLTDIFGYPPVTPNELEDKFPQRPGEKLPWTTKLSFFFLLITKIFKFFSIRASVVDPRIKEFVGRIKAEYHYTKLGTVGYCFGGATIIRLSAEPNNVFDSAIIAHPGGSFNIEQIKAIKIPSLWLCAEEDSTFPPDMKNEAEAVFAARKGKPDFVEYEFKQYMGTIPGFAIRPNLAFPDVREAFEKAFEAKVEWFKKTLDL